MTGALRVISCQFRVLGVLVGYAAHQCAADFGGVQISETRAIILDDQYQPDRDIATVFQTNTDTGIVESARPAVLEIGERLAVLILREGS